MTPYEIFLRFFSQHIMINGQEILRVGSVNIVMKNEHESTDFNQAELNSVLCLFILQNN